MQFESYKERTQHVSIMLSLSKIKYFLFYYRYNIIIPGSLGSLIVYDYLNLKEKRRVKVIHAQRDAERALKKN